jgi:hypothetical protein
MAKSVNWHIGLQDYDTVQHGHRCLKKTGSSSVSDDGSSIVIRNTGDRIPYSTRHNTKLQTTQGHRPSREATEWIKREKKLGVR